VQALQQILLASQFKQGVLGLPYNAEVRQKLNGRGGLAIEQLVGLHLVESIEHVAGISVQVFVRALRQDLFINVRRLYARYRKKASHWGLIFALIFCLFRRRLKTIRRFFLFQRGLSHLLAKNVIHLRSVLLITLIKTLYCFAFAKI